MRPHVRTALVALLAVGLLALFLRHADLGQVWAEIRRARVDLLLWALATMGVNLGVRAYRWQYLLEPIGAVSFHNAFRSTVIGFAASFLLPARAGEVIRPYLLARREQLSATATFATVVLERLIDLMTVLVLLGAFLLINPRQASADPAALGDIQAGGALVGTAVVAGLVLMFFFAGHPERMALAAGRVEAVLPASAAAMFSRLVRTFAEGLAIVRQPRRLLIALGLSLPLWLSIAAGAWAVASAFRIAMPFTGSFLLVALLTVGVAVPTPGAVGGFHEAFRVGATTFFGAPNDRAVGAAIVLHALSFLPVTLLGLVFIVRDGLSVNRMRRLAGLGGVEGEPGEVPVLRPSGR